MIRAMVWKEVREQGLIGLTLMVLGSGILIAAASLGDDATPGAGPTDVIRYLGAGLLATLLLAVTAGTVCGGALFAAEREAGTMEFLESLPMSRWRIWKAKLVAGIVLVVVQVAFVVGVAAALGLVDSLEWALRIALNAALAFVWGLYGSTVSRTTLGSVGVAVPAAAFAALVYLFPLTLIFHTPGSAVLRPQGSLIFVGLMLLTPVAGSLFSFTRSDRDRAANDPTPVPHPDPDVEESRQRSVLDEVVGPGRARIGLKALLWLSVRQLLRPGVAISAFAVAFGLALLTPGMQPLLVWPALALTAGVLAGITLFGDEQAHGTSRFWGERRLPIGRLWYVKLAVHTAFAVWLAVLLLTPLVVRAETGGWRTTRGESSLSAIFRTQLFDNAHLGSHAWKYLALPLAYGFVAGHLCGLLFRKAVVAAGVAGLVGGTAAAFWVPSLLSGGTSHWQLWLPPAIALVAVRFLIRAWAADRLSYRAPLVTLAGGLAAAILVLAGGIAYRVLEVPDEPGGADDIDYVAGLAPLEANDSGRAFRSAAERFARVGDLAAPERSSTALRRPPIDDRATAVPLRGWRPDDVEIHDWLMKVYDLDRAVANSDESWFGQAAKAAKQPTGLYEHPLRTGTSAAAQALVNGRKMGGAILAHGLQRQALGDPAAFPDDLRTALALSRALRSGSIVQALGYGNEVARSAFFATDHWLAALAGEPDALRRALRVVQDDEPAAPFDPRPHLLAERFVMREFAKAPSQWLPAQLTPPGQDRDTVEPVIDLIGLAWSVPWERERTRRLLSRGYESGERVAENRQLIRGRPGTVLFAVRGLLPGDLEENDRQLRTHRRAIALALAIRLYQFERGAPPPALNDLVTAGYIGSVPLDPYNGLPFHYRISPGEEFVSPTRTTAGSAPIVTPTFGSPVRARPGQAVLWCVGPNGTDAGGHDPPVNSLGVGRWDDLVFLVPAPPS